MIQLKFNLCTKSHNLDLSSLSLLKIETLLQGLMQFVEGLKFKGGRFSKEVMENKN